MFYILENMEIKNIIIGKQAEMYENCIKFINLAKEKNIKIYVLEKGDILNIDKNTYIEVLFPDIENTILENKINNNSLVFKLYYNTFSILFTGDIEKDGENYLTNMYKENLKCDILKVAHHGSKTSSTEEFINYAIPKIAVISAGKNNTFGHPNLEVLERLKKYNIKIYRTDINGQITIKLSKNGKIKIKTFI